MAKLDTGSSEIGGELTGPLLDAGAPYNGTGILELKMISTYLRTNWSGKLYPLPDSISDRTHWQYGIGSHFSESRRMLGSVMLTSSLAEGTIVNINQIVIEGSSQ